MGSYTSAIEDYTRAIDLSPKCGFYYTERALACREVNDMHAMKNDIIIAAYLGEPAAKDIILAWSLSAQQANIMSIKEKRMREFEETTIPSISERFSSLGKGAQRGSGFQQAARQAKGRLESELTAMEQVFELQQQQNTINALSRN
jgi:hypothetical protein